MSTALILLAAGKGTRMNSDLPKVMHPLAGVPMFLHALKAGIECGAERVVIVAGHGADMVAGAAANHDSEVEIVIQEQQLGTADAVKQARDNLGDFDGNVIVLYGDTPFIRTETLDAMLLARRKGAAVVVLGFEAAKPGNYGRLMLNGQNELTAIIEAKDASPEQKAVTLCNSGVICADAGLLFDLVAQVGNNNASGEYYLTDIVALATARGQQCAVVTCDEAETLGINSRAELAMAEQAFQARARAEAMENGVALAAPDSVFFAFDSVIGRDAVIGPNVVFGPGVTIESGAEIRAFCHLEGCHVSQGAVVGPFARLRPGAELAEDVRVGNFVEIKNTTLGEGAKANHLSYIGDAKIGARTNIGAGTIICNYDGILKHRTEIGDGTFIGSNTTLVAPVRLGRDAMTAAGSVITKEVPDGAMAISRSEQINKSGFVQRFFSRLKATKAARSVEK
ncbi:MAG: bifunctional UDP-N-acetylglucosamine diphosphorylase/glucosamine-1-phosphate N-acetyltransferase GlmU [Rhodobacteraceae bacterium]|nr:bifunctional UDP-N-acetylglucosamine diphosphorylase/glucosamine-1-phosphate N-acetyltransferase GlmU [Paracoccaceae bacterium]